MSVNEGSLDRGSCRATVLELPQFGCCRCGGDGLMVATSGVDTADCGEVSVKSAGRVVTFDCGDCGENGPPAALNLEGLRTLSILQYQRHLEQFAFEVTGWAVSLRSGQPGSTGDPATGYSDAGELEVAMSAGASTWCEFPMTLEDLLSVVLEYGPEHYQSYLELSDCLDIDVTVPDDISEITDQNH